MAAGELADELIARLGSVRDDHLVSAAIRALQAQVAHLRRDRAAAGALLPRLAPLGGAHVVAAGGVVYWGAADHWLGLLCLTAGDRRAAEHHLIAALHAHDDAGAHPFRAKTRCALASVVRPHNRRRADQLDHEAEAILGAVGGE